MSETTTDPVEACESALRDEIAYDREHKIMPSATKVAEALLSRRLELRDAYGEVYSKLRSSHQGLKLFFDCLLNTAAFWNPRKLAQARDLRNTLGELNGDIADAAAKLAALLDKRSKLSGQDGFYCDTHYSVLDVMEVAARDNHLYETHVGERLRGLRAQYDLKYWPSLGDFARVLESDARQASVEASNPLTAAGTASGRGSKADFFRAWFRSLAEYRRNLLPHDFELSDGACASFGNCVLNLGPDDVIDAPYVKRLRQRDREAARPRDA